MNPTSSTMHHGWDYQPERELGLRWRGLSLCQYHFATTHRKPFVHPIQSCAGVPLGAFEPIDHPWHRGVWFAWKYLNGVNFWEENGDGANDGQTVFHAPESVQTSVESARVQTALRYITPDGQELLSESRTVTIRVPQDDGTYTLDFHCQFRALQQVHFERTPLTAQHPWGGYAGMGWRASTFLHDFRVQTSENQHGEAVTGSRAAWAALCGRHQDSGLVAGAALFDHPGNPRFPTLWRSFQSDDFGYLNAAFLFDAPFDLPSRGTLDLRYRWLIFDGEPDTARLGEEAQRFART